MTSTSDCKTSTEETSSSGDQSQSPVPQRKRSCSSAILSGDESPVKRQKRLEEPSDERGIFDDVLAILEAHNHPWISVGLVATRWMACRGFVDPPGIDILIRDDQISSIAASILRAGSWVLAVAPEIDQDNPPRVQNDLIKEADAAFERAHIGKDCHMNLLRLWSEETFHMKVIPEDLIEVPDIYGWRAALVEEKYYPAANRTDGWRYGPDLLSRVPDGELFPTYGPLPRGKLPGNPTPVFIPTLPRFLEALVYQVMNYKESDPHFSSMADWQIDLLIRYLYLELPHQAIVIEFEVDGPTETFLSARFKRYVRKPAYVISSMGQVLVKRHDPTTFPEDVRDGSFLRSMGSSKKAEASEK